MVVVVAVAVVVIVVGVALYTNVIAKLWSLL